MNAEEKKDGNILRVNVKMFRKVTSPFNLQLNSLQKKIIGKYTKITTNLLSQRQEALCKSAGPLNDLNIKRSK